MIGKRRLLLLAIVFALFAANYAWIIRDTSDEPLVVVVNMKVASACPQDWAPKELLFARPLIFEASEQAWFDQDGQPVSISQRLLSAPNEPQHKVYRNVRVRMPQEASFGDALDAMRSLAMDGICQSDWADIEYRGVYLSDDPRRGQRLDAPVEIANILGENGQKWLCQNGGPSIPSDDSLALQIVPQARAFDIAARPCIIPNLPVE